MALSDAVIEGGWYRLGVASTRNPPDAPMRVRRYRWSEAFLLNERGPTATGTTLDGREVGVQRHEDGGLLVTISREGARLFGRAALMQEPDGRCILAEVGPEDSTSTELVEVCISPAARPHRTS